ncbi:MAG TPA: GNAT family N-acetyltransferase [Mariniphaga anaerophila]|uniref:GNAT family N-acetyltransferase n=1 Tax=Mariniphaga anaerophila TaxID=1484053 RepID=A0A831LMS9_9BACT|nr:GNAT family N-acetyltransferase [Mariniphaga anaerophila]
MGGESNSETLNPEIRKIRLSELENFVQSNEYKRFPTVPITPARAKSYLNNPHGKKEDVVLILAFFYGELVAFRSLFAGVIQAEKVKIRFGWCSGNWVHPDFRRKGISKKLLEEAFSAWNGKLMFTNYAPESEKLYLKTGWFTPIHQFDGARAYLFPKTVKLLAGAQRNRFSKWFFSRVDSCIACYSNMNILFFSYFKNPDIRFETIPVPDEETYRFLEVQGENSLFGRNAEELKWIFQYPWISEINRESAGKYPFSSCSTSFTYTTVKVWHKNKLTGVFIFSVREGHLKTLFFSYPPEMNNEIMRFIKQHCVKQKIEMITIYNSAIANHLFARKFPFLHVKKYGQKIYSTFGLDEVEKLHFQDGDGDVFFT